MAKATAAVDVNVDWQAGRVKHIRPEKPAGASRQWPHVPAGPERLESLLAMWIGGLPTDQKSKLKSFLFLG